MENSWLKLNRSIVDSDVFQNPDVLKVFIWILCRANYAPRNTIVGMTPVKLKAGQMIFGRKAAAAELGMSESKCYRIITTLEKMGTISKEVNSKFSVITVVNWRNFQGQPARSEQKMNSKRTASEQKMNTLEESKELKESKEERALAGELPSGDALSNYLNGLYDDF